LDRKMLILDKELLILDKIHERKKNGSLTEFEVAALKKKYLNFLLL
jgi:hypothetical protein